MVLLLIAATSVLAAISASYWQTYAQRAALEAHWASIGIEIYVHPETDFQTLWAYQQDLTHAGNVTQWQLDEDLGCIGLYECKLDDAQLKGIDQFPDLIGLHLKDTSITDEAIKHIAKCRSLKYLSLTNTQVTEAGAAKLATLNTLEDFQIDEQAQTTMPMSDESP